MSFIILPLKPFAPGLVFLVGNKAIVQNDENGLSKQLVESSG